MNRGWILKSIVCAMWHQIEKYSNLGSKRKSLDPTEINIGDWVTVSRALLDEPVKG
jgi:hypothetical protein